MKIKFIILILLTLSIISCNESNQQKNPKEIEPDNFKKGLTIEFNFKTSKSDQFKIMMNNIKVDEFQKKNIQIIENVINSAGDDNIVADFDPNNLSKQIVIHIGGKIEKEVVINGILISYGDKQFHLTSPEEFNSNLVFNKFIVRDSTTNKLTTKRIDGRLNPTIRIKNSLINQLQRE